MSADQITPERIAAYRDQNRTYQCFIISTVEASELLDALTASRAEVQRLTEEVSYVRGIMQGQEAECRAREEQEKVWRFKVETLTRSMEEARRSDAGRVEVPERAAWLTIEEMATTIIHEYAARPWSVFTPAKGEQLARAIAEASKAKGSRLSPSPQPATGAVDCASRELRELLGRVINAHIPGQGIALADWERACLLSGRFDQPMPDWEASPQPSADVVVNVLREALIRLCDSQLTSQEREEAISSGLDALRSSTNHDAQDAEEGR